MITDKTSTVGYEELADKFEKMVERMNDAVLDETKELQKEIHRMSRALEETSAYLAERNTPQTLGLIVAELSEKQSRMSFLINRIKRFQGEAEGRNEAVKAVRHMVKGIFGYDMED